VGFYPFRGPDASFTLKQSYQKKRMSLVLQAGFEEEQNRPTPGSTIGKLRFAHVGKAAKRLSGK